MFVLLIQFNRAYASFSTRSRKTLRDTDTSRARELVKTIPAMENGYFDVLLLPGVCTPTQFSNLALQVPRGVYHSAVDHVIELK